MITRTYQLKTPLKRKPVKPTAKPKGRQLLPPELETLPVATVAQRRRHYKGVRALACCRRPLSRLEYRYLRRVFGSLIMGGLLTYVHIEHDDAKRLMAALLEILFPTYKP